MGGHIYICESSRVFKKAGRAWGRKIGGGKKEKKWSHEGTRIERGWFLAGFVLFLRAALAISESTGDLGINWGFG